MKKFFLAMALILMLGFVFTACSYLPNIPGVQPPKEDVISIEDGYLVVNGVKTDYKIDKDDAIEVVDGYLVVNGIKTDYEVKTIDVIEIENGYLVVNGVKTDYQIKTDDIVEIVDGYVVVNGVKTQYKVDTPDVIEVIDGYVYVNGVKTDIYVPDCNHSWTTVTTNPTCTAGGYDTKTCALCGKSVKDNETAKLDHTYSTTL